MDKKLKIIFVIILLVITLFLLVLSIRFTFGGPEDSWICSAGNWIKHGNPRAFMPDKICN